VIEPPLATQCDPRYRYGAKALVDAPVSSAHTAYIIGGLYGNFEALAAIVQRQAKERAEGRDVVLVFNGDHNWFNRDDATFTAVNETVLREVVIAGNVEAGLAEGGDAGCGCDYPEHFDAHYVERSHAIMRELQQVAARHPAIARQLAALPYARRLVVGALVIGVVHGDAEHLAGWSFAADRLAPLGHSCAGDPTDGAQTPKALLRKWLRDAQVDAFACSHTCLPRFELVLAAEGEARLGVILNNGAAGMPNFTGSLAGTITRVSVDPVPPEDSLYGLSHKGTRIDAIPVNYDVSRWLTTFDRLWPQGSPAAIAYRERLTLGPKHRLLDAIGAGVEQVDHVARGKREATC
jgi:hypothetical protein